MARSRASAKAAGRSMERLVADYLAAHVDDRIDRRVKTGAKDKGDIAGVRFDPHIPTQGPTERVVVEVKNCVKTSLGTWANEAEAERVNDGALVGVVVSKRHGKGAPGDQWVHMTLRDFAALLSGSRPAE